MSTLPDTCLDAAGIDVGFFATKFTCHRTPSRKEGSLITDQFPSLAPRDRGTELNFPSRQVLDAVRIVVDDVVHIVGKDVESYLHGFGTKAVTSDYSRSTAYKALFMGALHNIARANAVRGDAMIVKTLVGGLPLSSIGTHRDELRHFMQQTHYVPHPADRSRTLAVTVKTAAVMAQPQGALMSHHVRAGRVDPSVRTLVLDMGGGTFDWYVATGIKSNLVLCGAAPFGALACATAVCDQIDRDYRNSPQIMARVDQALRTNAESFQVSATTYHMSQYRPIVRGVLQDALEQMVKTVGNLREMDQILFTGGAASMLHRVCKDAYPRFEGAMKLDPDPVTANVRGFHLWAEEYNLQKRKAAAAHGD